MVLSEAAHSKCCRTIDVHPGAPIACCIAQEIAIYKSSQATIQKHAAARDRDIVKKCTASDDRYARFEQIDIDPCTTSTSVTIKVAMSNRHNTDIAAIQACTTWGIIPAEVAVAERYNRPRCSDRPSIIARN